MVNRNPKHVGTRVWTENENGGKACVVAPLFPGEILNSVRIDAYAVSLPNVATVDNIDQPAMFNWRAGLFPFPMAGTETISTGDLDGMFDRMDEEAAGGQHLGGESAVSTATESWTGGEQLMTHVQLFDRDRIGRPYPFGGTDLLNNPDTLFFDEFHTAIHPKMEIVVPTAYIFGGKSYALDAETQFVMTEFDDSTTAADILDAYNPQGESGGLTATLKVGIWGGDNYIEADSFKEPKKRYFTIHRFSITTNPNLGRRA